MKRYFRFRRMHALLKESDISVDMSINNVAYNLTVQREIRCILVLRQRRNPRDIFNTEDRLRFRLEIT